MPTALLILPTGTYRAEEYLLAARRLGVSVVSGSDGPQALSGQMGDHFLELPLSDPEASANAIVAHGEKVPLDAVVAVDDVGLLAASLAAERLGLAHNKASAVRLTRDKAAMRGVFRRAGVPQPRFEVVSPSTPRLVRQAAVRIGPPVVLKPCSLSGSRGVIRADTADEAAEASRRIASILVDAGEPPDAPQLVEAFFPGREVAVEAILSSGRLDVITIFDKPDPLDGPYFEETIYLAPSDLDEAVQLELGRTVGKAAEALGLTEGPLHAEVRLRSAGGDLESLAVIEIAGRTIGGRCSKALRLRGGASLEELVVARAVGLQTPPPALAGPAGVLMVPIPRSGVLRQVRNVAETKKIRHVTGVELTIPPGRRVRALPEGDRYLGFVFAAAERRQDAESALREALALLEVDIDRDGTAPKGDAG